VFDKQNPTLEECVQELKLSQELFEFSKLLYGKDNPRIIFEALGLLVSKLKLEFLTIESLVNQSDYNFIENLIKTMYGFDHPLYEAFIELIRSYRLE
jgi:hypothetical protein